jgi:hypothetical protein
MPDFNTFMLISVLSRLFVVASRSLRYTRAIPSRNIFISRFVVISIRRRIRRISSPTSSEMRKRNNYHSRDYGLLEARPKDRPRTAIVKSNLTTAAHFGCGYTIQTNEWRSVSRVARTLPSYEARILPDTLLHGRSPIPSQNVDRNRGTS